jgi:hypothetical protein
MMPRIVRVVLSALLVLLAPQALTAQQDSMVIRGRVAGPDNAMLAGQRVVLHRILNSEGATIAETTSSTDGEFVLSAPATPDTSALYFVAARYDGELYIGPAFRAGQTEAMNQVIQVGVPGTSASALLEGGAGATAGAIPMGRPATNRNWLLLAIPLLGVAAVALYALVPRQRIAADRALLIRIAELDERMVSAPTAQRETLQAERTQLIGRLGAEAG